MKNSVRADDPTPPHHSNKMDSVMWRASVCERVSEVNSVRADDPTPLHHIIDGLNVESVCETE